MTKNETIEKYYKENYNKLIKLARKHVGNYSLHNAEDAVMEAFSRACRYFRTYNDQASFDKWFKGILHNCINDIKSEERSMGVVVRDDVEEMAADEPKNIVFTKKVEEILIRASMRDQEILNMYFFYGYRTIEISKLTSVSHDVIRDVIRRFRIKLR